MGSRSKRYTASYSKPVYIVNDQGENLGWIDENRLSFYGEMPETILQQMIGRPLSDVIVRRYLCGDVRIIDAGQYPAQGGMIGGYAIPERKAFWFVRTAGDPLLPIDTAPLEDDLDDQPADFHDQSWWDLTEDDIEVIRHG